MKIFWIDITILKPEIFLSLTPIGFFLSNKSTQLIFLFPDKINHHVSLEQPPNPSYKLPICSWKFLLIFRPRSFIYFVHEAILSRKKIEEFVQSTNMTSFSFGSCSHAFSKWNCLLEALFLASWGSMMIGVWSVWKKINPLHCCQASVKF